MAIADNDLLRKVFPGLGDFFDKATRRVQEDEPREALVWMRVFCEGVSGMLMRLHGYEFVPKQYDRLRIMEEQAIMPCSFISDLEALNRLCNSAVHNKLSPTIASARWGHEIGKGLYVWFDRYIQKVIIDEKKIKRVDDFIVALHGDNDFQRVYYGSVVIGSNKLRGAVPVASLSQIGRASLQIVRRRGRCLLIPDLRDATPCALDSISLHDLKAVDLVSGEHRLEFGGVELRIYTWSIAPEEI